MINKNLLASFGLYNFIIFDKTILAIVIHHNKVLFGLSNLNYLDYDILKTFKSVNREV